jgi:hypothetical protein
MMTAMGAVLHCADDRAHDDAEQCTGRAERPAADMHRAMMAAAPAALPGVRVERHHRHSGQRHDGGKYPKAFRHRPLRFDPTQVGSTAARRRSFSGGTFFMAL